jgi:hypothetical protein
VHYDPAGTLIAAAHEVSDPNLVDPESTADEDEVEAVVCRFVVRAASGPAVPLSVLGASEHDAQRTPKAVTKYGMPPEILCLFIGTTPPNESALCARANGNATLGELGGKKTLRNNCAQASILNEGRAIAEAASSSVNRTPRYRLNTWQMIG